jgi:GntR family transcriptional regulator
MADDREAWASHELIGSYLREGILSGDFEPDTPLPSTRVLKKMFGAAPQTIFSATQNLAKEGLAYSKKGTGIMVIGHKQRTMQPAKYKDPADPGQPYRWIGEASKRGYRGSSSLLDVSEVVPPADVRKAMSLAGDAKALRRTQVLMLNDEPCELVKNYYPLDLARGTDLEQRKKIRGGAPRLLADLGYPPARCIDRVSARLPTPEQYEALQMTMKLPILRTFRITHSVGDLVIEVTVMAKAGNRYELEYEF